MALLAEQLVDEWLNRKGFFTLRGIKRSGVGEIDLLGIKLSNGKYQAWHVEVQASFRPIGYIAKLTSAAQIKLKAKSQTSAKTRSEKLIKECAADWVNKKFRSKKIAAMREKCWPNLEWKFVLVHANVRDKFELDTIAKRGVEIISLTKILKELCEHRPGEIFGAAGTDIAELIQFFAIPSRQP